jgi:hypothetical protein
MISDTISSDSVCPGVVAWEEMDFLGKGVKNGTQWLEPIYKLRIVNRKNPFQIYI